MKPTDPGEARERRHGTTLEPVDDLRTLSRPPLTARDDVPPTQAVPGLAPGASASAPGAVPPAEPFRPVDRPSMALLTVLDDGDDSGETIRLRAPTFVIGRVDGDLVIPHDAGISGRHAEVSRRAEGDESRWYLRDLRSTNGTFVRASQVILSDGQEVLIGRGRFRFDAGTPPPAPAATRKWLAPAAAPPAQAPAATAVPALVELTREGEGRRYPLAGDEVWVGRDPAGCHVVLDDPTVDPRHARLALDLKGRWVLANARSLNGVWARVDEVPLGRGGQFLCGEQRFLFRML